MQHHLYTRRSVSSITPPLSFVGVKHHVPAHMNCVRKRAGLAAGVGGLHEGLDGEIGRHPQRIQG
jgi:hypothetical protein